ncbi:FKBP-type peptidyl-prolyl cis-trans isomerase [Pedobacter sp. JCM 36344]|uniref:FKBP-type peptidyl-prolyl cis-trans isomerase n=1 Tax=Pedobacter sp. JCM 36344 TaxID=3374280 RepID=UPI003978D270
MLKKISSYAFVLIGLVLFNSCKKEYESIQSIDDRKLEDYFAKNNITAIKDPKGTGFYYQITNPGTGDLFLNTDSVLYNVTLKSLSNGTTYYSTPPSGNLGNKVGYTSQLQVGAVDVATGKVAVYASLTPISTAIRALKPGGSAKVFLPSYLAFGNNGEAAIGVPSNDIIEITINTFTQKSQAALDEQRLQAFLLSKGINNAVRDVTGVYYVVTQAGTGTEPIDLSSAITINYTGRLLNGTVFETNTSGTVVQTLSTFITGWNVLSKFRKGTKIRLIIPSTRAYGNEVRSNVIWENTPLDFDIEILEVAN